MHKRQRITVYFMDREDGEEQCMQMKGTVRRIVDYHDGSQSGFADTANGDPLFVRRKALDRSWHGKHPSLFRPKKVQK